MSKAASLNAKENRASGVRCLLTRLFSEKRVGPINTVEELSAFTWDELEKAVAYTLNMTREEAGAFMVDAEGDD